jgi:hypothetical protein
MRSHPMIGCVLLLGACGGGGSLPITLTASPLSSPPEAMACARAKLDTLKYQLSSFDQTELRLTARKVNNSMHRADPLYRRNVDRMEVQVAPEADGKTSLTVTARTYAEFETHRGPTEQEERASADAQQSARAVVDACGHS